MGTVHLKDADSHTQNLVIAERIPHPAYSALSKYNDIALLKLADDAHFNEFVRPACLCADPNYEWTLALATGYGKLTYGMCATV